MPNEPTPSPDDILPILLQASLIIATEGAKSQAFKDYLAQLKARGVDEEVIGLVMNKVGRVPPGWFGALWEKFKGLGQVRGFRQVLDFFGPDYQLTWKLIVTALAIAMAWLHVPGWFQQSSPQQSDSGQGAVPPLPPYVSTQRTQAYFRSRYDAIHVERAPKALDAKGDLSQWDPASFFYSACKGEWASHYFLRGAMMYDDHNLYLAAIVGDPFPMRNAIAASADAEASLYAGGALQVHLALRPVPRETTFADLAAQQTDRQLVKITMWYSRPDRNAEGKAQLMVSWTMNDGHRTGQNFRLCDSTKFQAAYRPLREGLSGNSLVYAIPWSQLNPNGAETCPFLPQQAGQKVVESRICWEIHWSGADGKTFVGKLSEVVNPNNEKNGYETAEAWGKVFFH
jgi:hypothetical protein